MSRLCISPVLTCQKYNCMFQAAGFHANSFVTWETIIATSRFLECDGTRPVLTITSSHSRHTGRGNQMKVITDEQSGSRPFGLLGWNPWDSVGCGPAAVVCRPLRKTRGLQSVRCVLRAEGGKPGRKQHQQWTNNEVHLHRPQQPLPDAAAAVPRVSHQCFCSPTGYLWSLGSSGSCSSRKVRTQSACWLGSEVCAETNHIGLTAVLWIGSDLCECDPHWIWVEV